MTLTSFPNGLSVAGFASPANATITVGSEDTNAINVAVQLLDGNGDNLATAAGVQWYLSDDADGSSLTAAAPDGGAAIGTDGLLIEQTANTSGLLVTESDGAADVALTEAGAATWYLVLVLPSGRVVVSGAITFAA